MRYSVAKILYGLFLKSTVFSNLYALRCPSDWNNFGTLGCFKFGDSDIPDFAEAQAYCNALYTNAYLAEVKDRETQIRLTDLAGAIPNVWFWWLGASDFHQVRITS